MPSGDLAAEGANPAVAGALLDSDWVSGRLPRFRFAPDLPDINRRVRGPAVSHALLVPELLAAHLFLRHHLAPSLCKMSLACRRRASPFVSIIVREPDFPQQEKSVAI